MRVSIYTLHSWNFRASKSNTNAHILNRVLTLIGAKSAPVSDEEGTRCSAPPIVHPAPGSRKNTPQMRFGSCTVEICLFLLCVRFLFLLRDRLMVAESPWTKGVCTLILACFERHACGMLVAAGLNWLQELCL
jgi:hypothetical protein